MIPTTETLEKHINQNGVRPGPRKLEQFKQALTLRGVPTLYAQDSKGNDAVAYVKIFDPTGSWTWYITEWDGEDECFGLVKGHAMEYGYISLQDLSATKGLLRIGLEIDVHFLPTTLGEIKRKGA